MADGYLQRASQALPKVGSDVSPEAALALLKSSGVLIIENAMPAELLTRVRSELEPWFSAAHHGAGPLFGKKTKKFGGVLAKAPAASDLAIDPLVLGLMESILMGDGDTPRCDCIELNLTQAIGIEPEQPPQFLHRDEDLWPFPHTFELMANAMWTLDDFTLDNGPTRLVPGSHLWDRARDPQPGEALPAIAPAGSVILWLGGVLHGGGVNRSQSIRRGVVLSYRLGWLASGEKLLLSTPPEAARQLPEKVQRLLGYQLHHPNLGWVEGQDPLRWLNGEFTTLAAVEDNLTPAQEALLVDVAACPEKYAGYLS